MLETLFLQVLNMSVTGGTVILFVLIARLLLKKAPKVFSYALWGVVLFRLCCPVSFESAISLLPYKTGITPAGVLYAQTPGADLGIPAVSAAMNAAMPAANLGDSVNPMQIVVAVAAAIWLVGIGALLIYSVVSLLNLRRRLKGAVQESGNIYTSESLTSPFVMGLFSPKIYLPASLTARERDYILLHEQTHIKRLDHVVKLLGFFVLCVHWFNPLVWVAFFLCGRDMELSCDEAVIKKLGSDVKKDYSTSLLTLATGRRIVGGTPLAFGEGDTKSRIQNVLNYKKPAFWVIVVSVIAVVAIGVGLMANPKERSTEAPLNAMRPMVMVDGVLYLDTGKEVTKNVDNSAILGEITSAASASEKPTKNGQCNFGSGVGAKYAAYEDGMAVFLEHKWFFFEKETYDTGSAEYTIMRHDQSGEVLAEGTAENQELAQKIVMDGMVKSAAWEGVDVGALEGYYCIRQRFPETGEIQGYYAYRLADGTAAIQFGAEGRYSILSDALFEELEKAVAER